MAGLLGTGLLAGVLTATGATPAQAVPAAVTVPGPWGVAVNPATDTAYVSSRSGNALRSVSGNATAGGSAPVGSFPLGTAYNPFNGYVYVANFSGGSVTVVDPATMTVVATVSTTSLGAVGANPYWVAVDESTGQVVVSFYSAGATVGVIDPATNALTSLALPAGQSGDRHVGITVDSVHHVAYVADSTAGAVSVVPLSGSAPTAVTVGGSPAGVLYSAGKVYVGFASGSLMKVIDTTAGNAVSSVTVGNTPSGLAVAAPTTAVFTMNNGDGTLSVIDGSSGTVVNTITPGTTNDYLTWAAADTVNNRLYVGNFTAGKVHVLAPADTEAASTLALSGSAASVTAGDTVTYTATPSNGTRPVTFYDTTSGSTAISSCTNVALSAGSASCTVTYPSAGSFSVTARTAEKNFLYQAATSSASSVTVAAVPAPTTTAPPVITPPVTTPPVTTPPATTPTELAPDAPRDISVRGADASSIVRFSAPEDHGSPITGYEYSLGGGATWKMWDASTDAAGTVTGTVGGLTNTKTYSLTFRARNAVGPSVASDPVSVTPRAELTGPSSKTLTGNVKTEFSGQLSASGGMAPYTYAAVGKTLPPRLTLSAAGRFGGRPTQAGTFSVKVRVTDHEDATSVATLDITIERATAASLSAISRSGLLRTPANPDRYTGKKRLTKAWQASADGTDAYPVSRLKGLNLVGGQAATLSGDGLFGFDRGVLTRAGRAQVKALAQTLQAEAKAVRCEGYTDYAGSRRHELELSRQRARAVCAALVREKAGVGTKSVGYGPSHPAVVGGSAKARRENRRVVVLVTR
ncbi:hypothetical protein GCM10022223_51680 [Kineosporia mesophila]|uniref:Uncharacterized protein n=1 Tax=Kineosporia mesophila TaxID=566012 RepID=A0ABP7AA29_9ACTN